MTVTIRETAPAAPSRGRATQLKRWAPVAGLAAVGGLVVAFDLHQYLSFSALQDHNETLRALVAGHRAAAVLGYIAIYAVATALSLPGGLVLTVAGGFLFGPVQGTAITVVAATIGASAIFLVARSALGDALRRRAGGAIGRMAEGFRDNALSYLLVLRLVPLFPFFLVNLVPAFLGVRLGTYVLGTFVGIIPGTFVYTSVGTGLGSVFASGAEVSVAGVLTPEVIVALAGLALLSLLPVVYKRLAQRKAT
ncbi:TVP38/TMEM64 family protein [Oceanibacterium hippocampi]|uniref:TVP38/TMEM64 family inner membrane protein YdjZ n=1 Tax=Oceanibacterium hippocampi TaxID=745714 RepID=A0A1Y5S493_9PROT|nr:TVP38/TMEM64 family protein [Oceanibacterium hippocampi]SLN32290.1 TVP38/TMEM64 family inner membrane protein YdjZ [Oceanibacterium hippocampi]